MANWRFSISCIYKKYFFYYWGKDSNLKMHNENLIITYSISVLKMMMIIMIIMIMIMSMMMIMMWWWWWCWWWWCWRWWWWCKELRCWLGVWERQRCSWQHRRETSSAPPFSSPRQENQYLKGQLIKYSKFHSRFHWVNNI